MAAQFVRSCTDNAIGTVLACADFVMCCQEYLLGLACSEWPEVAESARRHLALLCSCQPSAVPVLDLHAAALVAPGTLIFILRRWAAFWTRACLLCFYRVPSEWADDLLANDSPRPY